jgi:hypothetical protein
MKKGGRVSNGPGGIAIKGISPILRSGKWEILEEWIV